MSKPQDKAASRGARTAKKGDGWKSNLLTIGGALLLALFIRVTLFEAFAIDGPSMEPTLLDGDRVVVAKYPFGLFLPFTDEAAFNWGGPAPGDVIILHISRNGEVLHTVDTGPCSNEEQKNLDPTCRVYQETLDGTPHRMSHSKHDFPLDRLPLRVPEDHVYVLGDHRDSSNDSRNPLIGAVPNSRIKGKTLFIYMSWKNTRASLWERIRWSRVGSSVD
jgi:signal peptidase I